MILVGFDYQGGGVDFAGIARNRQARLVATNPGLTVTTMDVGAGTTAVSSVATVKGKPVRSVTTTQTHSAVSAANYSTGLGHHTLFDRSEAGRMSITDLYTAVQRVGAAKSTAGGLVEVSVFSHGWMGGPILVNSEDNRDGAERDPADKDARVRKDFATPNVTVAQLAAFKAAFAPGAFWWNWGCSFTSAYRQVTHRFINTPVYRRTPAGKLKDTDKIPFEFTQEMAQDFYEADAVFFPQGKQAASKGVQKFKDLVFERTVRQVKDFFLRGVHRSYHSALAGSRRSGPRRLPGHLCGLRVQRQAHQAAADGDSAQRRHLRH